ncbi:MAG: hypothetical protein WC832_10120 [Anaerolineales bacterium]
MNKRIIFALLALSLTTMFCTFQPGGQASPTPDVNAMVNATLTAMTFVTDTPITTVPAQIPNVPATGGISGHLSYPSDFLPPMRVVAFDAANYSIYLYVDTVQSQSDYTITGLPAGLYHVVSYRFDSDTLAGGYTQSVPCGLAYGCNDHSFIDVTVTAGQTTTDINPGDWYADAGTFPPMPNP